MRPLPFVWPYALVFWAVYIWAFLPEWKIVQGGIEGVWIALLLAFPLAFVRAWSFPPRAQLSTFAVGLSMILLGSLLRRYCWRTLGKYFTGDVRARPDQPVIRTGPYRLVRHPSYTAGIMMFVGIGLGLGNWFSFVLLAIAAIATYAYRVPLPGCKPRECCESAQCAEELSHPCHADAARADPRKNDEINLRFHNRRADLLISTERLAGKRRDVEAQLGAEYGARRANREQVVVHETVAVATDPIEEVVVAVVVRD